MGSNRVHQLSSGLYVSGTPEQYKERAPSMTTTAVPYTGGDVKTSGEFGKMFDINVESQKSKKSGSLSTPTPSTSSSSSSSSSSSASSSLSSSNTSGRAGSFRATSSSSNSGPVNPPPPPQITHLGSFSKSKSNSGPLSESGEPKVRGSKSSAPPSRQSSGPLTPNLPATGLITSGPLPSNSASKNNSGPIENNAISRTISPQANKHPSNQAINHLSYDRRFSFIGNIPKVILWTVAPLFIIGLIAGGFILVAVHNAILLIIVSCLIGAVILLLVWNSCMGQRVATQFVLRYPSCGLDEAKDGQYVKITGIVTCGSVPLETSYQRVSRCVYTSCALYEYRSLKAKPANSKHRLFTWGLRHLERRAAEFYISDYKSGLRALVKVGYGAAVTPYVEENTVVDVTKKERELSSFFVQWLAEHNLSSDDRILRLKEGYIKEGSAITVMGVVQRMDNIVMIVPPSDPISTGCQWGGLFLPSFLPGIILFSEDTSKEDVIPV